MRNFFNVTVALAILGLTAASAAAQQPISASLSFVSDPGDYIGGGQSRLFALDTASITVRGGQNGGYVGLTVFPFAGGFWFLDLAAPQGVQLLPGAYENAVRYPFQSPTQPGLSLSGDGRGCNTVTGRFDVLDAKFGPNGYVERFHATFEQHCEGGTPKLVGDVQIVNPPPPPPLQITLTIDTPGRVERMTGKAYVTASLKCTATTSVNLAAVLNQRLTRFSLATGNTFVYAPCSTTPSTWTLEFTPAGPAPFGNGMAQLDAAAGGYDSYYGNFVNIATTTAIQLLPR